MINAQILRASRRAGRALAYARRKQNISLNDTAKLCNVPIATIVAIENGSYYSQNIETDNLVSLFKRYAQILESSTSELATLFDEFEKLQSANAISIPSFLRKANDSSSSN
jgi:cytoskeletal protein RodZ